MSYTRGGYKELYSNSVLVNPENSNYSTLLTQSRVQETCVRLNGEGCRMNNKLTQWLSTVNQHKMVDTLLLVKFKMSEQESEALFQFLHSSTAFTAVFFSQCNFDGKAFWRMAQWVPKCTNLIHIGLETIHGVATTAEFNVFLSSLPLCPALKVIEVSFAGPGESLFYGAESAKLGNVMLKADHINRISLESLKRSRSLSLSMKAFQHGNHLRSIRIGCPLSVLETQWLVQGLRQRKDVEDVAVSQRALHKATQQLLFFRALVGRPIKKLSFDHLELENGPTFFIRMLSMLIQKDQNWLRYLNVSRTELNRLDLTLLEYLKDKSFLEYDIDGGPGNVSHSMRITIIDFDN